MRGLLAGVLLVAGLSGCTSAGSGSSTPPASTAPDPSTTRSAPVADQTTQLSQTSSELRADVDALSVLVPAPTESFAPEDRAVSCGVGGDDDGSKQWVYSPGFRYAGPGAAVVEPAAAELERRGYSVGQRSVSPEESSFTAVKDGAAITVRDGPLPDEPGSAVVFLGYGPCVGPDGMVDTRNPG